MAPALASFAGLAFLSTGVLIGTYAQQNETVYVYVVNDGDENKEYQVSSSGQILSEKVAPEESPAAPSGP